MVGIDTSSIIESKGEVTHGQHSRHLLPPLTATLLASPASTALSVFISTVGVPVLIEGVATEDGALLPATLLASVVAEGVACMGVTLTKPGVPELGTVVAVTNPLGGTDTPVYCSIIVGSIKSTVPVVLSGEASTLAARFLT